jgi:hypothetical protein
VEETAAVGFAVGSMVGSAVSLVAPTVIGNNCRPDIQDLPSRTSNHRIDSVPTNCPDCTLHLRGRSSMQHSPGSSNRFHCLSSALWERCGKFGMGRRVV